MPCIVNVMQYSIILVDYDLMYCIMECNAL